MEYIDCDRLDMLMNICHVCTIGLTQIFSDVTLVVYMLMLQECII